MNNNTIFTYLATRIYLGLFTLDKSCARRKVALVSALLVVYGVQYRNPAEVLPENLGRGVRPASQNP